MRLPDAENTAQFGCGLAMLLVVVALGAGLAWRCFKWASGEFS